MDSTGITPVMPMGDGGFGMNGIGGIFALLILLGIFNGGGFGWGGNGNTNSLSADMQRGFDNQNSMANEREILSAVNAGTAQAVAATNQSFHDTLNVLQDKYSELARDVYGVSSLVQ